MIKQCVRCGETKIITEFSIYGRSKDGRTSWCKECVKKYNTKYYEENKEKYRELFKEYRKNNPGKKEATAVKWQKNNLDRYRELINRGYKKRMLKPMFKLGHTLATSIRQSLKNGKNGNHWESLVGYTLQDLMIHLEKQFKPGMNWDNQGKWHIDHIIPVTWWEYKTFNDREFKQCWALCNLQPLWAKDNFSKGNRIALCMGRRINE